MMKKIAGALGYAKPSPAALLALPMAYVAVRRLRG